MSTSPRDCFIDDLARVRSWPTTSRLRRLALWLTASTLAGSLGCTPIRVTEEYDPEQPMMEQQPGQQPNKPGTVVISPSPVNIDATSGEQQLRLSAFSTSYGDITRRATWSLSDPSIGTIQLGVLTVRAGLNRGGKVLVYANYGVQSGQAIINLKVRAPDLVDASAPANAKDYFGGSNTGTAPSWVYPFPGTMLPRNLVLVNLQWRGQAGAAVYRLQIESATYSRDIYVGSSVCSGGTQCQFTPTDADWLSLARAVAGGEAKLTVSGSASVGAPFGSAELVTLFSPEDVKGGIYYWSTSITGIYRVPLGAKTPQVFINRGNEFGCSGCHAVSRDGKKVALEFGSANGTGGGVVDGTSGTKYIIKPPSAGQWNLQTFSPDGDMLLVNWQQQARVINSTTGAKLFDVPVRMAQPEWSPDGKSIVYVAYPADGNGAEWNANNIGDITVIPWNGGAFGAPQTIVASVPNSEYHFYPSWTPDSKWIVFNTGKVPCKGGSGCNTYDPTNTILRLVRATPGAKPLTLTKAGVQANSGTNWPRVAPFIQDGKLVFFTFSARFPYGLIKSGSNPQIWMAGVDLDKAASKPDEDPSFPPFWLPFQNVNESNHLGTWTTDVVCIKNEDCPSEFQCSMGMCVPRIG